MPSHGKEREKKDPFAYTVRWWLENLKPGIEVMESEQHVEFWLKDKDYEEMHFHYVAVDDILGAIHLTVGFDHKKFRKYVQKSLERCTKSEYETTKMLIEGENRDKLPVRKHFILDSFHVDHEYVGYLKFDISAHSPAWDELDALLDTVLSWYPEARKTLTTIEEN